MKTAAGLFVLFTMAAAASAGEPSVLVGERDCRVVKPALEPDQMVVWKGPCKDGHADGAGVLQRYQSKFVFNAPDARYEVTMAHGRIVGEGKVVFKDGATYIGFFKDGVPHGKGYTASANGDQYEGDYEDGAKHGNGTRVYRDGTTYVGEWKYGKRDGLGTETFALGGRYEGAWKAGKFHGKGLVTYAGSGHRHEGQFADGRVLGAPVPAKAPEETHGLRSDTASASSRIMEKNVTGSVPFDKSWAALTPDQQAVLKAPYLALEEGDEPPYPVNGLKPIFEWIGKAQRNILVAGELRLYVLVGKDGNAISVTRIGSPDPDMTKFATIVVMKEKYKPAVCRGAPCEMVFPFAMMFEVTN